MDWKRYAKAVVAAALTIAGAAAAAIQAATTDGRIDSDEWGTIVGAAVVAALTTFGVWRTRNAPPAPEQ